MSELEYVALREFAVPGGLVGGPFGSKLVSTDYVPEGVPVIRGQNLASPGYFDASEFVFVSEEKVERDLSRNLAEPGDVVFTQRGTLGQVGIVPDAPFPRYVISQSQMRMRVDRRVAEPRYIYYCFRDPRMVQMIQARAITTGVPHINLGILAELPIPRRPLVEQRRIVEVLGALDDKIAVNERIAQTALELGTAIYAHRASSAPTWRSVSLADAAQWYSGGTPRTTEPAYWNGHIPWISAISLKSPWIDDSPRKLTSLGAANGTRIVPPGTIIFVVRGSSLKEEFRIGIAQCEVAFGQDCKALVAVDGIDHDLLFHAIRHHTADILELVDETSIGAGRLATDLIEKLLVRVPDTPSDATVDALKSLNQSAAAKQRESRTLAELRDTLLPKLISGELRVRDAEKAVEEAL
jgi:type I restriction enzyme S subunit